MRRSADATPDVPLDPAPHPHERARRRRRPATPSPDASCCSPTTTSSVVGRGRPTSGRCTATRVGDELVFVQHGTARLESVFGRLDVGAGDYVVIPAVDHPPLGRHRRRAARRAGHREPRSRRHRRRSTCRSTASSSNMPRTASVTCACRPTSSPRTAPTSPCSCATVPAGHATFSAPIRSTSSVGTAACIRTRSTSPTSNRSSADSISRRPSIRRSNCPGAVVCSFVPRLFDFHPDAVKVPYHHANTDSDEVLFYSAGNFMSRAGSGIGVGSISYHPAGFVHGPQPGSVEASLDQTATEEVAVMLDTFAPLRVTAAARAASDEGYPFTWSRECNRMVPGTDLSHRVEPGADGARERGRATRLRTTRLVVVDVVGERAHLLDVERADLGVLRNHASSPGELSSPAPYAFGSPSSSTTPNSALNQNTSARNCRAASSVAAPSPRRRGGAARRSADTRDSWRGRSPRGSRRVRGCTAARPPTGRTASR